MQIALYDLYRMDWEGASIDWFHWVILWEITGIFLLMISNNLL